MLVHTHALHKPLTISSIHSGYYLDNAEKLKMWSIAGANYFVKLGRFQQVEKMTFKQEMQLCYYYYYYYLGVHKIFE